MKVMLRRFHACSRYQQEPPERSRSACLFASLHARDELHPETGPAVLVLLFLQTPSGPDSRHRHTSFSLQYPSKHHSVRYPLTEGQHRAVLEVRHGVLAGEGVALKVLHHGVFHYLLPRPGRRWREGGGEGAYSFVACLRHLTIDRASLSRRSTVPTPIRDTSNIWAPMTLLPYIT